MSMMTSHLFLVLTCLVLVTSVMTSSNHSEPSSGGEQGSSPQSNLQQKSRNPLRLNECVPAPNTANCSDENHNTIHFHFGSPNLGHITQPVLELNMTKLGDKYYHFSKGLASSWKNAEEKCRSHGLELAALETEEENRLVVAEWKIKHPRGYVSWVGGTDEGSEGTWRWSSTGRPLTFTDWSPECPFWNQSFNCMILCNDQSPSQNWCDIACRSSAYYICEATE